MNPHIIPDWLNYGGAEFIASEESIAACDGSTITMVKLGINHLFSINVIFF